MKNLTPYLKALKAFETAAMTALIAALRVAGGGLADTVAILPKDTVSTKAGW